MTLAGVVSALALMVTGCNGGDDDGGQQSPPAELAKDAEVFHCPKIHMPLQQAA